VTVQDNNVAGDGQDTPVVGNGHDTPVVDDRHDTPRTIKSKCATLFIIFSHITTS